MNYPEYVLVDGKKYKINTSFQTALQCFDIINDSSIGDHERALAVLYKLLGFIPTENTEEFFRLAKKYLQCGETIEEQSDRIKDMDFRHDAKLIVASFMSDYQIDLSKADLHWWLYIDLIRGLTENTILNKVREIRNYDLSKIKDPKDREKIIRAKEAVALPIEHTKEEQEAIDEFEMLLRGGG